jgi:hypothetical protein
MATPTGIRSIDGSVYYEVDVLGYPVKDPAPLRAVVNSYQYDGSGDKAPSRAPILRFQTVPASS